MKVFDENNPWWRTLFDIIGTASFLFVILFWVSYCRVAKGATLVLSGYVPEKPIVEWQCPVSGACVKVVKSL